MMAFYMQPMWQIVGKNGYPGFFYPPNNFIVSSHNGFFFGKKSSETIKAYEDSSLIYIEREEFKELLDTNHQFERTVRILAEESYIQAIGRVPCLAVIKCQTKDTTIPKRKQCPGCKTAKAAYCLLPGDPQEHFDQNSAKNLN